MDTGRYHVVCGKIAAVAADRNGIAFFGGARYDDDDYIHRMTTYDSHNNTTNAGITLSGRTD
jgi:hypothetical protein